MAEKKVKTRVQSKHDVEKNWNNATNFSPLPGEIIIYDKDNGVDGGTHTKPRIKVGDGTTLVGALPFVVDKEETDAQISAVDSKVNTAISSVSVSGRDLTFTTIGGESFGVKTQDTDTNTKVTNTKNNTAKAYITGTTSNATNTGTQVFDENVYLDTEAGTLVATKFKGTATKATADASGNTITSTYETKTDATAKVANMNKEAYLSWGGRNIAGAIGPVGASLSSEHSANRIAYLNPAALTFETSNNGGSSWTAYSVTDADKIKFVTTASSIKVGSGTPITTSHRTRLTINAQPYFYTRPRKMLLDISSPHGLEVLIEYKTGASDATWKTLATATLSGWSGWNELDLSALSTLGGSSGQTGNNWYLRLTFANTSVHSSYTTTYSALLSIRLFGDTGWTTTSNMGKTGHLYSYDHEQNATFPANVTATKFNGTATKAEKFVKEMNVGSIVDPVYFEDGEPKVCTAIPLIHTGTSAPSSTTGKNGDLYVMPYATNIPAIYSGTAVPDHSIGVDGDIYIMY